MCQLLAMNCNVPTDICFSFEGFRARGGRTDEHSDGWGIAFFEGKGCRILLDDRASSDSEIAELIRRYPIHSLNVIAHIRKATMGKVSLENTHPFQREMWGQYWVFAHNGDLHDYNPTQFDYYQPVGDTDSEKAFCSILNQLRNKYPRAMPSLNELFQKIETLVQDITPYGIFNFVLSNGSAMFVYCASSLFYIIRQSPFSKAQLIDEDISIDFKQHTTPNDRVAIITTKPLTNNEIWMPMSRGQLTLFKEGRVYNEI